MKTILQQTKQCILIQVCKYFATIILFLTFGTVSAQWVATSFPENEFPYNITKSSQGTLYVTTYPGSGGYIYMSRDRGENWIKADVEGAVYSATLQIGDVMFFGGRGSKIARTLDDGETWDLFNFDHIYNAPDADIYALAYHNNKLYAAIFGLGICVSEDMGITWNETDRESLMVSYEIDGRNTYTMESFNGKLFAIGANGIWMLNEDEITWSLQRETWFSGNSLVFNNRLYISYVIQNGTQGIEFTEDGEVWQEIPNNNSLPSFDIRGFQTDGENIFVGTVDQGVFYTPDEGETWIATEDWPPFFEIPGVVTFLSIPMDFCFLDGEIFAASYEMGIYKMEHPNPPTIMNELNNIQVNYSIYPNPALDFLKINFTIEHPAQVSFSIYDMLGHQLRSFNFGNLSAGTYTKQLDITNLKSSGYLFGLRVNDKTKIGKFLINK